MSKYKLDFPYISAYCKDRENVKFHNSIQSTKFLPKKVKWSYLLNVSHNLFTTVIFKKVWFAYMQFWSLQNKICSHFLIFSNHAEAHNEILIRHSSIRWLLLMPTIGKMPKCLSAHKIIFSKCGTRRMSLYLDIHWGWEWRKDCSKAGICWFFKKVWRGHKDPRKVLSDCTWFVQCYV